MYYNVDEKSLNKLNDKHSLLFFHMNACSLSRNTQDNELFFHSTKFWFDVKVLTEKVNVKINSQLMILTYKL